MNVWMYILLIVFPIAIYFYRKYSEEKKLRIILNEKNIQLSIQLENNLNEKEKQYQDIFETANSIIIRWDPNFAILSINPYAEAFFKVYSSQIEGKDLVIDLFKLKGRAGNERKSQLWNIFHLPGQFTLQEYDVNIDESLTKTISWSNRIFKNEFGHPTEVLSIGNDITDIKFAKDKLTDYAKKIEIQNELLEKAFAESKMAIKSKNIFFSKITHELRTPLHAVIGFSQILERDQSLPNHLKGYVNSLYQNGVHLLAMINDLLELSKFEAGKMTLNRINFSLTELWVSLFSMFGYRFLEKDIVFELKNPEILSNKFYLGDMQKLKQILINLIGNALKYTSAGKVYLSINIELKPQGKPFDLVEFIVADTGIGIPKDQFENIFEAFHQTEQGSSYQQGTGLGLAISHQLVELLGGRVSLQSELGTGSVFSFTIPLLPLSTEEVFNFPELDLGPISSAELLMTNENQELDENLLVLQFLETIDISHKTEILRLIRLQDFPSLLTIFEKFETSDLGLDILKEKAHSKKYKFFIELIQSFM